MIFRYNENEMPELESIFLILANVFAQDLS